MVKSAPSETELAVSERMDAVTYVLITNKYATYKELRDDYSIDEVIDLYEACMVALANKMRVMEEARSKTEKGRR